MGGAVSGITSAIMGDPAQNNYSGNYDSATNGMNANISNQNKLANQIQQQSQNGASPADLMLQQANNQNLQQTQALIGSQRGINPGMAARQAAQAGASINQQAAGQMSAQRAQEGINANQLQSSIYGNIGNEYTGQQNTAAQSSLAQNGANAQATAGLMGGAASNLAGPIAGLFASEGGMVPENFDDGGAVPVPGNQPKSFFGQVLNNIAKPNGQASSPFFNPYQNQKQNTSPVGSSAKPMDPGAVLQNNMNTVGSVLGQGLGAGISGIAGLFSSPDGTEGGGGPLGQSAMAYAANGGMIKGETYAALGKMIPGKAKAGGNNLKNDTVPAMLSPQEIILPRSVTLHPDAPEKAKQFVQAVLAKKMRGKK